MNEKPEIYIDALRPCVTNFKWKWPVSCHLFTTPGNLEALHAFAKSIGLQRRWFQEHASLPHYDLNSKRRKVALECGAVPVGNKFVVHTMRQWRKEKDDNGSNYEGSS